MLKRQIKVSDILVSWYSYYKDKRAKGDVPLAQVYEVIRNPACYKEAKEIKEITEKAQAAKPLSKEAYDKHKLSLPGVTFAARFSGERRGDQPHELTGLAVMDIDKLPKPTVREILDKASKLSYVVMAMRSVSYEGVHLIVRLPGERPFKEEVVAAQRKLWDDLAIGKDKLGEEGKLDEVCKDVARLCFLAHDPEAFANWNAKPMDLPAETTVETPCGKKRRSRGMATVEFDSFAARCLSPYFEKNVDRFADGSTKSLTFALAAWCNRAGFREEIATEGCWRRFGRRSGQEKEDFLKTFAYAYRTLVKEHGQGSKKKDEMTGEETEKTDLTDVEVLEEAKNLPFFPEKLYDLLPKLFTDALSTEDLQPHTRAAALLGLMPQMAAALSKTVCWERKWRYPAIYTVVVGKPASGKGVVTRMGFIADAVDMEQEEREDREMQRMKEARKVGDTAPQMSSPPRRSIAADTTDAKLVEQLHGNDGLPLLMEASEMSAFGKANRRKETGDIGTYLRQAYEGETIKRSTKSFGNIVVRKPKLCLCLTGTPNLFAGSFESNEDGFTSRLTGLVMPSKGIIYQPLPFEEDPAAVRLREGVSYRYGVIYQKQASQEEPDRWKLDRLRTRHLNIVMRCKLQEATPDKAIEESTILRQCAKVIRYATVFSAVRHLDEGWEPKRSERGELFIDPRDYEAALLLAEVTLEHTLALQSMLRDTRLALPLKTRKREWLKPLFADLPDHFRRKDGIKLLEEKYGLKRESFRLAMQEYQQAGKIERLPDASYRKVKPSSPENPKAV